MQTRTKILYTLEPNLYFTGNVLFTERLGLAISHVPPYIRAGFLSFDLDFELHNGVSILGRFITQML